MNCRLVEVDGETRRFVVYVPEIVADSEEQAPVVFMFHGTNSNGEKVYKTSRWRETADAEGFIAVFPTGAEYRLREGGTAAKWHDYSLACVVDTDRTPLQDDVAFVDEILADVTASEEVDEARLYVSGFSNGSQFAQRLAVERGDRFAAVASFAGPLEECVGPDGEVVEPIPLAASPIPTWLGIGSLDELFEAELLQVAAEQDDPFFFDAVFIDQSTTTFQLERDASMLLDFGEWNGWEPTVATWPESTWSIMCWSSPQTDTGGSGYAGFVFSVLDGVEHRYPNAKKGAGGARASTYVTIAEVFWRYFEAVTDASESETPLSPCAHMFANIDEIDS